MTKTWDATGRDWCGKQSNDGPISRKKRNNQMGPCLTRVAQHAIIVMVMVTLRWKSGKNWENTIKITNSSCDWPLLQAPFTSNYFAFTPSPPPPSLPKLRNHHHQSKACCTILRIHSDFHTKSFVWTTTCNSSVCIVFWGQQNWTKQNRHSSNSDKILVEQRLRFPPTETTWSTEYTFKDWGHFASTQE